MLASFLKNGRCIYSSNNVYLAFVQIAGAPGTVWPLGQPHPDEQLQHTGWQHRGGVQGRSGLALCSRRSQVHPHGALTQMLLIACRVLQYWLITCPVPYFYLLSESQLSNPALQAAQKQALCCPDNTVLSNLLQGISVAELTSHAEI